MAEAKFVEKLRPHTGVLDATGTSRTSPKEQKQGKLVAVWVPKLTDLPGYMDAVNWPMSAKIMRMWFDGEPSYTMSLSEKKADNPLSQFSRPDRIDTTLITMDWVLSFERAQSALDEATSSLLTLSNRFIPGISNKFQFDTKNSRNALIRRLHKHGFFKISAYDGEVEFGDLSKPAAWQHENWQFQRKPLDSTIYEKAKTGLFGKPDDLYGALGTFAFYFAASGTISVNKNGIYSIKVRKIGAYVRDTYDFNGPQYLGHWGPEGVEILISAASKDFLSDDVPFVEPLNSNDYIPKWSNASNLSGDIPNLKIPVGNQNFQEYREKNSKGADLLLFSDVKIIDLKFKSSFITPAEFTLDIGSADIKSAFEK